MSSPTRSSPTSATASSATPDGEVVRADDRPVGRPPAGHDPATLVEEVAAVVRSHREATWIVDHVRRELRLDGPAAAQAARAMAARRAAGEPLQYVLGRWPFRALDLDVDRRVLVPRPETEQVVEVALAELARLAAQRAGDGGPARCCDLGTGSGAIALSLAAEAHTGAVGLEIWATDRSPDALEVARRNRDRLAREGRLRSTRVLLALGDWFGALPRALAGEVDLVVSNPPYVAEAELPTLDATVRDFEPAAALVAGSGSGGVPGMAAVEAVLVGAHEWLRPTGSVVVEIAPHQAEAARAVASSAGFRTVGVGADLAGRPRTVVARC